MKAGIGNKFFSWQLKLAILCFIAKFAIMEVTVKIDKFGRVLIPKKIREAKGYKPGTELSIVMEPHAEYLTIAPVIKKTSRPELVVDDLGIPTFVFGTNKVFDYDFTEAIKKDQDERGVK